MIRSVLLKDGMPLRIEQHALPVLVGEQAGVVGEHIDAGNLPLPGIRIGIVLHLDGGLRPGHPFEVHLEVEGCALLALRQGKPVPGGQRLGHQQVLVGHRQAPVVAQIIVDDDVLPDPGRPRDGRHVKMGCGRGWIVGFVPAILVHISHANPARFRGDNPVCLWIIPNCHRFRRRFLGRFSVRIRVLILSRSLIQLHADILPPAGFILCLCLG